MLKIIIKQKENRLIKMRNKIWLINNLVNHQIFNNIITVVIILQAAVLALETFSEFNNYIFNA